MDFSEHCIVSAAGSAAVYAGTGDALAAGAYFSAGVFMDLDHFADYWRETGLNFRIREFMDYFWMRKPRHLWLLLHSFEILPLAAGLLAWRGGPAWAWAALAGWFTHLYLDNRVNRMTPWAYFMSFRVYHRFDASKFDGFKA